MKHAWQVEKQRILELLWRIRLERERLRYALRDVLRLRQIEASLREIENLSVEEFTELPDEFLKDFVDRSPF